MGQLTTLIRGKYLVDAQCLSKVQGMPFKSREIEAAIDEATRPPLDTTRTEQRHEHRTGRRHDEEGLVERPGGPLVPRLRRLRHPPRRPDADARSRHRPREHRVHLGHRLLEPLPVLHEHLRHALDPRPRAGHRHRRRRRPPRPRRVGDHRRRRRPVDRRQPPDPCACAATSTSTSCCSTTGSTASPRASSRPPHRSARSPSRRRWARSTRRSTRSPSRSAPRPASSPAPTTSTAST